MLRVPIFISLLLFCCLGFTTQKPARYQIDLIVFLHQQNHAEKMEETHSNKFFLNAAHSRSLQPTVSNKNIPYHLLPSAASHLRNEFWALNHKPQYRVLFHYSWLQPSQNEQAIALLAPNLHGWDIEGFLQIKQNNYYSLNTALRFSPTNNKQAGVVFMQKQRLKANKVYYLDHPHVGMLIKIHQIN